MAKKALLAEDKNKKLQKIIKHLKKEENWMKWGLIAAGIVILILLLLLGYVTDWGQGLHKAAATPTSTSLDAQSTKDASTTPASGTSGTGSGGSTGTTTSTGSTGATDTSTDSQGTSTNNTSKDTKSTSTTTNNTSNTSTTTNNNTTTPGTTPPSGLLSLYADSSVGETLDTILNRAAQLGLTPTCTTDLLLKICVFQQNGQIITVKSLLGTGLVTSILKN